MIRAANSGATLNVMDLRDPVSSASHLLTAAWAVYATLILLRLSGPGVGRRVALGVYGLSMVLLYAASGTFHGRHHANPDEFRFFQKIDQSAIFVLIAGTCTPIMLTLLRPGLSRRYLLLLWGIAFAGIGCLWLLPKAPHTLVVLVYVGMGWLGILPAPALYRVVGWRAMNWMWLGAGLYTLGAVFELAQWPLLWDGPLLVGPHEVLHLCDTAGSVTFFLFISRHVVGYRNIEREDAPSPHDSQTRIAA